MQQIDVLYFAWVRERIGLPKEIINTNAETVAELIDELRVRGAHYEAAFSDLAAIRVAINQELVAIDTNIKQADEIAFFPPMTGG